MENKRSNVYKYESNSRLMITMGGPMVMMLKMLKFDVLTSNDPSSGDDGPPSVSSPSESLSKVRFHCFLTDLCLASQISGEYI
jgi:hypothetical protein